MAFPFYIGADGRTDAPATLDEHVRGEIIQLLLTNPGERPFLPSFGGGLRRLIFEGNDDVTAGLAKATVNQALSYWLKDRVEVTALNIRPEEATLSVDLSYRVVATGEEKYVQFQHEI
jgi:phage baseplate assembly protein W